MEEVSNVTVMRTQTKDASAFDTLVRMGMVETNAVRLCAAMDHLHDALSRMDLKQRSRFLNTDIGKHAAELANWYGRRQAMLRSDY